LPRNKLDVSQFALDIKPLALVELSKLVSELGVAPERLCAEVGVSNIDMCAGELISIRHTQRLIRRAIQLTGRMDLGLELGRRQNISHFGLPGFAMSVMPTFGDAVEIGARYQRQSGALMEVSYELDDDLAALIGRSRTRDPVVQRFMVEELFTSVMALCHILIGDGYQPRTIELTYPIPPYAARYLEVFGCPVRFRQPRNRFVIPRSWFGLPLASPSPVVAAELCTLLEARALSQHAPDTVATIEQVLRRPGNVAMSVGEVAAALGLSPRTLRRRLTEAGTSFRILSEHLRALEAQHLLRDKRLTVVDTGEHLGFSNARTFRRAFKRWVGEAPGTMRHNTRA